MRISDARLWLAVMLCSPTVAPAEPGILLVEFSTAIVPVAPETLDKRRIMLPSLDYAFAIRANCPEPGRASSVSISIADTRQRFDLQESDSGLLDADFSIPAEQLAPLVTDGFCVAGDAASEAPLVVRGALTSQASVLCTSGDEQSLYFASEPLAVKLICEPPNPDQDDSSTDR